jgi:hypothetical protein
MHIGLTVEHKDEKYKIINHEKPYANFARHYIIQSMETGDIKTVYRHQIFVSDLRPSVSEEDELMELSQSDIDFLDAEIEENPAPPSVVNVKPRIKSAPSDETLDFIAKARTEVTTNRQTNWCVKVFQGTKMYSTMHNYALAIKGEIRLFLIKKSLIKHMHLKIIKY